MNNNRVEKLVHEIKSKCCALRNAAELLSEASAKEREEFLELMRSHALYLAKLITETLTYEKETCLTSSSLKDE